MGTTVTTMAMQIGHAVMALWCVLSSVDANSLGLNIPSCDAYDESIFHAMDWATAPTRSTDFSVRSGDGKKKDDPKTYTPDQLTYIHVRALKQFEKYRGLLLYAVNSSGHKVGAWNLPQEQITDFQTPAGACNGSAVMHSGAVMKAYHNSFAFRAPPKGAGTLTFHCLLKMGGANYGYFAWPNNKDLKLKEGSTASSKWFKGDPGQSCNGACRKAGQECDEIKLTKVNSKETFEAQLSSAFACKLPLVAECSRSTPAEAADGFCEYQSEHQSADGSCKASTCTDKTDGESRFCPCTAALALANEDEWSEMREQLSSTDSVQVPSGSNKASTCDSFVTQDECEANGCFYEGEEGMSICKKTKGPW